MPEEPQHGPFLRDHLLPAADTAQAGKNGGERRILEILRNRHCRAAVQGLGDIEQFEPAEMRGDINAVVTLQRLPRSVRITLEDEPAAPLIRANARRPEEVEKRCRKNTIARPENPGAPGHRE